MHWRHVPLPIESGSYLPYGNGRSYGDSCLNREGRLIDTRRLDRLIHLDNDNGVIRCEAGVLLRDLLRHVGPIKFD